MYLVFYSVKLQVLLNGADRIFKDKITKITDYAAERNLHFALKNRLKNYQLLQYSGSMLIRVDNIAFNDMYKLQLGLTP